MLKPNGFNSNNVTVLSADFKKQLNKHYHTFTGMNR